MDNGVAPVGGGSIEIQVSQQKIRDCLDKIHGQCHDYVRVKPELRRLESLLLNHFELQKKTFYNSLRLRYQDNRQVQKMLDFLECDLRDVKIRFLTFADSHPADMADVRPGLFVRDFQELSVSLLGRFRSENDVLIPLIQN